MFNTMSKDPYHDQTAMTDCGKWWDPERRSGGLADYLLDNQDFLSDSITKRLTALALNLTSDVELAQRRFDQDIAIVNVFFDTPIITQIKRELRVTFTDQISAIGGALSLFTGVSLISFVEIVYWLLRYFKDIIQDKLLHVKVVKPYTESPKMADRRLSVSFMDATLVNHDYNDHLELSEVHVNKRGRKIKAAFVK